MLILAGSVSCIPPCIGSVARQQTHTPASTGEPGGAHTRNRCTPSDTCVFNVGAARCHTPGRAPPASPLSALRRRPPRSPVSGLPPRLLDFRFQCPALPLSMAVIGSCRTHVQNYTNECERTTSSIRSTIELPSWFLNDKAALSRKAERRISAETTRPDPTHTLRQQQRGVPGAPALIDILAQCLLHTLVT